MNKVYRFAIVMMMALVLMMSSIASAQEPETCFGLDAQACAAIAEATENTAAATSFYQNFSINFTVGGTPEGEDLNFSVTGEGSVVTDMTQQVPINFDVTMVVDFGEGPVPVSARLVDGNLYLQTPDQEGWIGVNLLEAAEQGDLPVDLEALLANPEAAGGDMPVDELAAFAPLLNVPGFISYTSAGGTYTFVADFTALLTAPEFMGALTTIGELAGDPSIASLGMLLPMLLSEGTITVTQVVSDNMVNELGFGLAFLIDAGMLTGDVEAPPINIGLDFNVALSQVNESFTITVPENVTFPDLSGAGF